MSNIFESHLKILGDTVKTVVRKISAPKVYFSRYLEGDPSWDLPKPRTKLPRPKSERPEDQPGYAGTHDAGNFTADEWNAMHRPRVHHGRWYTTGPRYMGPGER